MSLRDEHRRRPVLLRHNGQPGLGPLTLEARRMLLNELLALRAQTGQALITDQEVRLICEHWQKNQTQEVLWEIEGGEILFELQTA